MEELDRNTHQFHQGAELWEIWPQVPLIHPVCDYLPPSHMQENNPQQHRALMWKERKAQSHSWMLRAEPISAFFFSPLLLLTWDQGSLICIDVYEVSLEKFFSLREFPLLWIGIKCSNIFFFSEKVSFLFHKGNYETLPENLNTAFQPYFKPVAQISIKKWDCKRKKQPTRRQNKTHRRPWENH